MLRLANRTTRATAAGLLGLLVAAPPPSRADDDEGRRSRAHVARHDPGDPDGKGDRDDRNERRRDDHGRNHRRDLPPPRAERDRYEPRDRHDRPAPPPPAARRHDRDHDQHRDRRVARDRSEWRGEHREWRDDHRDEWRARRRWDDARYAAYEGRSWHWHGDRWCPPGHRSPPGRRVGWWGPRDDWRWARYRRPVIVHSQYYCAPCARWYGDRYGFDRHVYGYHELPQLAFRDAVAQVVWGLVYFGL